MHFFTCTFSIAVWIGLLWGMDRKQANYEREKKICIGIGTNIFSTPPAELSPTPTMVTTPLTPLPTKSAPPQSILARF
jgi:hypothetical protein